LHKEGILILQLKELIKSFTKVCGCGIEMLVHGPVKEKAQVLHCSGYCSLPRFQRHWEDQARLILKLLGIGQLRQKSGC